MADFRNVSKAEGMRERRVRPARAVFAHLGCRSSFRSFSSTAWVLGLYCGLLGLAASTFLLTEASVCPQMSFHTAGDCSRGLAYLTEPSSSLMLLVRGLIDNPPPPPVSFLVPFILLIVKAISPVKHETADTFGWGGDDS